MMDKLPLKWKGPAWCYKKYPKKKKQRKDEPDMHASTSRKRSHEDEDDCQAKRPKSNETFNWGTSEVEWFTAKFRNEGICIRDVYRCKDKVGQKSMHEVKDQVAGGHCNLGYHFYPAFKEALLKLLTDVEEIINDERRQVKAILIHGAPDIGKSTLAQCLAYFLALFAGRDEKVNVSRLKHSSQVDADGLTDDIMMSFKENYVIVDQMNTNSLNLTKLRNGLDRRFLVNPKAMPVIMFTSGHYPPSDEWLDGHYKSGWLFLKLIQMRTDVDLVNKLKQLKNLSHDVTVNSDDILKVSTVFGHIIKCLEHVEKTRMSATDDNLRENIFPAEDLNFLQGESHSHILWIAFEEIFCRGFPKKENFTDDSRKISPHILRYLGLWSSQIKDSTGKGVNALLDQMDIAGPTLYDRNNYSELVPDSYDYIFLNKNSLHNILKSSLDKYEKLTPEERLKVLMRVFGALKGQGSHANQERGVLLEYMVMYICEAEKYRAKDKYPFGMTQSGSHIVFNEVQGYKEVATVSQLCSLPLRMDACKSRKAKVFCRLNLQGTVAQKGYDYAHIETCCIGQTITVREMQLFRVTVNANGKDRAQRLIMTDVLTEVKRELVKLKLITKSDADVVVRPFFVEPTGGESVNLPCSNSSATLSVEVLSFPSYVLERYE